MQTNDRPISELMKDIHTGKAQLPDFQRGWVWDDNRIRALIASITSNFPIGAAMFLEYGNENIRFKYRVIEGAPAKDAILSELILGCYRSSNGKTYIRSRFKRSSRWLW